MKYLDHAATSPVRPEVREAIAPFLGLAAGLDAGSEPGLAGGARRDTDATFADPALFGNPSSRHVAGERAARILEDARARVARVLGVRAGDVVFTSGGSEADNLAIKGAAIAAIERGARHVVTTPIEHEAVLRSVDHLRRIHGFEVSLVDVDEAGRISADAVAAAIRPDTAVVSIGYANNEVGTVQPLRAIADAVAAARASVGGRAAPGRAWLHTDAVQAAGWLPLDGRALGVDAMTVAGHKIGAPKGCGVLAVRSRVPLEPLVHGGGQERGRRSGTESVASAVAMAVALECAEAEREAAALAAAASRDAFVRAVLERVPDARLTGAPIEGPGPGVVAGSDGAGRLPGLASFVFPGTSGEAVLLELERRGVLSSSGSACAAGDDEPSHVLTAMGVSAEIAQTSVRFTVSAASVASSLAATGTADPFAGVAAALADAVTAVRSIAAT